MRFVFPILLMAAGMADAQDIAARLKQIDANNAVIQSARSTKAPAGYLESANRAVAENKPLVIFVGQEPRLVPGSVTVRVDSLDGYRAPAVVTAYPDGRGWLTVPEAEVSRSAVPFGKSIEAGPTARREGKPWLPVWEQDRLRQMWPKAIPSDGFVFYKQTEHSQRIAITSETPTNQWYHFTQDDNWGNAPPSLNPNRRDRRWVAPGGLYGVDGWQSFTAAHIPGEVRTWTQPLPIANGGIIPGGKRWAFPDGTVFADLLTKDGEPFELRMREKSGGRWDSFVAWSDRSQAPAGYHGAGRKCAECHDGAGSSEQYGILVRGCDTVFSFNPYD